jgi:hypothetical protein
MHILELKFCTVSEHPMVSEMKRGRRDEHTEATSPLYIHFMNIVTSSYMKTGTEIAQWYSAELWAE